MATSNFSVFATLDTKFVDTLQNFISQGSQAVSQSLATPLASMLTIYVAWYGWLVLRGVVNEPIMELAMRLARLAVIVMLVKQASNYNIYVTQIFFTELPKTLGDALASVSGGSTGNSSSTIASSFDKLLDASWSISLNIWKQAGWDSTMIINGLVSIVLIVATAVAASLGYVVSLYARVALAIVLALGPAFIACAMFESTRRFTESWIGQLVNYVILQVLALSVGSLVQATMAEIIKSTSITDVLQTAVAILAVTVASAYLFYQVPHVASALAGGGAALNFRWGGRTNGPISGAAGYARRAAGRLVRWGAGE